MSASEDHPIRRYWKQCLFSVLLGLGVMAFVIQRSAGQEIFAALREVAPRTLVILSALVAGSWLCHGARYWVLARTLGHPIAFGDGVRIAVSVEFAVAATPSGSGGAVARLGLLRMRGMPLYLTTSVFSVNLCSDLCVSILLASVAGLVVAIDPRWQSVLRLGNLFNAGLLYKAALALAVLIMAILLLLPVAARLRKNTPFRGRSARRPLRRLRYFLKRARRTVRTSWRASKHLFRHHRWAVALDLFLAVGQWTCRYGVLPTLVVIFGPDLNPLPLFAIQGLIFIAALVLVLPGGGGGIELLSAIILPAFVPPPYVPAVLLLWRFFTYYLYLLAGAPVFAWTLSSLSSKAGASDGRQGLVSAQRRKPY